MDSLNYNYNSGTNQLNYVTDGVSSGNYIDDIDNESSNNYIYDSIGNLIHDCRNLHYRNPLAMNLHDEIEREEEGQIRQNAWMGLVVGISCLIIGLYLSFEPYLHDFYGEVTYRYSSAIGHANASPRKSVWAFYIFSFFAFWISINNFRQMRKTRRNSKR